jgi:ubiquinone/menaquinone biosynthesis C-methylase UbiE
MTTETPHPTAGDAKSCCAALYAGDWARLLLGPSYHPGGLAVTERLGALLGLTPGTRVLDVAAGRGTSAIHLAQRFGCQVVGVDYSAQSVAAAQEAADRAGVGAQVRFVTGDAECLPVADGTFDAVLCECAFCTFPDKRAAAAELARVLRCGGRVGLSDLTRRGLLPPELEGLLAWVACIADARPVAEYVAYLAEAGLAVDGVEPHDEALAAMVREIRTRLLGAEVLVKLKKLDLPGADFEVARALARAAAEAVARGQLGYALIAGAKRPA